MAQPRELLLHSRAERALAQASTIDEVKDIRDRAEAAKHYAKKARLGQSLVVDASVLKLRAERKLGQMLHLLPLSRGAAESTRSHRVTTSLNALGITKNESHRAQRVTALPASMFKRYLSDAQETRREPTSAAVLRMEKQCRAEKSANGKPKRAAGFVTDLGKLIRQGKTYACLYADPPWQFQNRSTRGSAANHYPTMTTAQISSDPVAKLDRKNSLLHLWCPAALLPEGLEIIAAWGFQYKSNFVWVKPQIGTGNYWRMSQELLMLGVRGNLSFTGHSLRNWQEWPRNGHSQKPEQVRRLIEQASPGPYLELYARSVTRGWIAYGNQFK